MMSLLYIEQGTGACGDAGNLVFASDVSLADVADGASDSEITDAASDAVDDGSGITMVDVRRLLVEVQEQKGDWRGTLDYLILMLNN